MFTRGISMEKDGMIAAEKFANKTILNATFHFVIFEKVDLVGMFLFLSGGCKIQIQQRQTYKLKLIHHKREEKEPYNYPK